MEQALPLPIMNRVTTAHTARRHSVAFVASVAWLIYAIVVSYISVFFGENGLLYYIKIVPMLLILFYQLYYLLRDVNVSKSGLNLTTVYFIFIILHYLLLRSGLERAVNLIAMLTCLLVFKKYPFKKREINKLYYLFVLVVFLKILNGATLENLADTTKFNPNECAIHLMLLFCISLVAFAYAKKLRYLIVTAICFALQFYFTSRGALGGCALFFVGFVLFRAWKRAWKVKTAFVIILLLSVLGILVAYIYSTVLFEAIGKGNVTIFGKDLFTGRQKIWQLTFDTIKDNLWFGVGSRVNEATVLEESNRIYRDSHNMALAVLVSFGLLHFILFYLLFSYLISTGGSYKKGKRKYVPSAPVIFMCVITLMNYFEMLFFYKWTMPMVIVAYGIIGSCRLLRKQKSSLPCRTYKRVYVG
ncbi:MAG: O-antigen ligase family protein [Clostridiales bacterium]|nr:O-antigen ligase family protein [Clostridiales bacterium]